MEDRITTGILLAGGEGTRLRPFTTIASKQLYPIGDKFVIDFPLHTLKNLGVKDLIIILGGPHFEQIVRYVKDGHHLGFNSCSYVYQEKPLGISHAISLCESIIHTEKFYTILGDNVFANNRIDEQGKYIDKLGGTIDLHHTGQYDAQIVLHRSNFELQRFGVASLDKKTQKIIKIEEKPQTLDDQYNQYAISGLYQFDYRFFNYFRQTKPSARGEFEIVDLIKRYQDENCLGYSIVNGLWMDAGTLSSINFLTNYFQ